ncbi:MAG: DUF1803 domain-containing protein [Vagococcus sp.]
MKKKIKTVPFQPELLKLLDHAYFDALLMYMKRHKDNIVMLRDLKKAFPECDSMDLFIDDCVQCNILSRSHGRYSLNVPIIDEKNQLKVYKVVNKSLEKFETKWKNHIQTLGCNHQQEATFNFLLACNRFMKGSSSLSLYDTSNLAESWFKLPLNQQTISGKLGSWVSFVSYDDIFQPTIYMYFNYLRLKINSHDVAFSPIYHVLGDISMPYYFQEIEKKMRRLIKGKPVTNERPNIFLTSLLMMNYVSLNNEEYNHNMLVLDGKQTDTLESWLENILTDLPEYDERLTNDIRFMVACCTYEWCLKQGILAPLSSPHCLLLNEA